MPCQGAVLKKDVQLESSIFSGAMARPVLRFLGLFIPALENGRYTGRARRSRYRGGKHRALPGLDRPLQGSGAPAHQDAQGAGDSRHEARGRRGRHDPSEGFGSRGDDRGRGAIRNGMITCNIIRKAKLEQPGAAEGACRKVALSVVAGGPDLAFGRARPCLPAEGGAVVEHFMSEAGISPESTCGSRICAWA